MVARVSDSADDFSAGRHLGGAPHGAAGESAGERPGRLFARPPAPHCGIRAPLRRCTTWPAD